ncbi:MAG TPA: hypothetical protein VNE63_11810 [Candidatus Acidoferrales bacterium]|nr:hypothetical protein [Candidatus Acidoferrales bacterium]
MQAGSKNSETSSGSEIEMILPFLLNRRRNRWKELFQKPKGRKKLLHTLWNGDDLDRSLMTQVQPNESSVQAILLKLNSLGAPAQCHLLSARSMLDGKDLDLASALEIVLPATLISCIPGKLAYYKNDDRNGSYILYR